QSILGKRVHSPDPVARRDLRVVSDRLENRDPLGRGKSHRLPYSRWGPAGVRGAGQGTSAAAKIVSRGEGHTLEGRRLSCRLSLRGRGLVLVVRRPESGLSGMWTWALEVRATATPP